MNTANRARPVVAIYQPHFLSVSMTFIYRQLLGVEDEFHPIVLATRVNNQNLFPYPRVYVRGRSVRERLFAKVIKATTGRIVGMSAARLRFWRRILLKEGVSFIHTHFGTSAVDLLPLVKATRLPLVVTFHGADASSSLNDRGYVEKLKEVFEYSHVVTVSKLMAERLMSLGADRSRTFVHYIGAPVEDFDYVERKELRLKKEAGELITCLQVSNFVEKKGHVYTVEAFRNLARHYPNSRLVLAGDGPLRGHIERHCADLGLVDKVTFVGAVSKPQVIDLMAGADIFLHHSVTARDGDQEGIPTAIMEAMATGLVVLSTFHSGIPELVEDGKSGFLVPERDVEAYTRKLIGALDLGSEISRQAASTIRTNFNQTKQNEALKAIYRQVLARAAR